MVNAVEYKRYVEKMDALIRDTLHEMECQPIFFIGSGIPKRFLSTPSWMELLKLISVYVDMKDDEFNYISQKHDGNAILIADELQVIAFEWAWKNRPPIFPRNYYEAGSDKSLFLKKISCEIIDQIFVENLATAKENPEFSLLRQSNPHAIITTNYDKFLEEAFEGYEPVIGEKVIKYNLNMIGEIFKIHGSTD